MATDPSLPDMTPDWQPFRVLLWTVLSSMDGLFMVSRLCYRTVKYNYLLTEYSVGSP